MCDRCLACQGKDAPDPMNYKNFSSRKAYDLTTINHDGYVHLDSSSLTPWLSVPGFNMETMMWDLLHNLYLGTARDFVASALKTLIQHGCYNFLGETDMDTVLSYVDARIRKTCSKYKCLVSTWNPVSSFPPRTQFTRVLFCSSFLML